MKLGAYTAVLHDKPIGETLRVLAVARGHDVAFWAEFLRALEKVDPNMAVNIEHEDQELGQLEGPRFAARTLVEASGRPS